MLSFSMATSVMVGNGSFITCASTKISASLKLTPLNPAQTDAEGDTRAFSIESAPHERPSWPLRELRAMLLDSAVDSDNIRTEEFVGY